MVANFFGLFRVAIALHDKALWGLLHAKMEYLAQQPGGRMIKRMTEVRACRRCAYSSSREHTN